MGAIRFARNGSKTTEGECYLTKTEEQTVFGYPEIEERWLLGNATPMSAQQWETAFRWCAEKFGREWLQPTRPGTLVSDAYVVAAI